MDHVWTRLCVVMATQTVLTNQMRSSAALPPLCPCVQWGSFSVPTESVCQPVVCVTDGWTAVLLMGQMSKVICWLQAFQQYPVILMSLLVCRMQILYPKNIVVCMTMLPFMTDCPLLAQTVVSCVTRESSCVLEDVVFSTSTAAMDTMTVGTSVMREGVCLIFGTWNTHEHSLKCVWRFKRLHIYLSLWLVSAVCVVQQSFSARGTSVFLQTRCVTVVMTVRLEQMKLSVQVKVEKMVIQSKCK